MSSRGINDFLSSGMKTLRHHPSKCGICLNKFADSNPHSPVQIPCGHIFGRSCLINWTNNTTQANHNKCPICLDPLFDKDRSGNPSNDSSGTNDPGRTSHHATRREDTPNPQREPSRTERQVASRYPPAPTAVTPTPSEDFLYGHTLRRVTARIPSRRPAIPDNTAPAEARDLLRGESRSDVGSQGSSRDQPRDQPRSNVVSQGSSRDQPRLEPQDSSRDQPRYDSRSNVLPQGTYRIVPPGSYRDQPRYESRTMAPVTPRSAHPRVSMLNPAWQGNQLPTRTTSAARSTRSTGQTDTPSIRCEVYVDARQISNHYTSPPRAEDDGTDSGTSSETGSMYMSPRSSHRGR